MSKVTHTRAKDPHFTCTVVHSELTVTNHNMDLGVVVNSLMKMSAQYVAAVKKAGCILGIIRKGIENKTANNMGSCISPFLQMCSLSIAATIALGYSKASNFNL